MVKRFDGIQAMREDIGGLFVHETDYDALSARIRELEAVVRLYQNANNVAGMAVADKAAEKLLPTSKETASKPRHMTADERAAMDRAADRSMVPVETKVEPPRCEHVVWASDFCYACNDLPIPERKQRLNRSGVK
jgi:hypothetical protein